MVDEVAFLRWIPLVPLISACALGLSVGILRRPLSQWATAAIGCSSVAISFALCGHGLARLIALEAPAEAPSRMLLDIAASWMGAGIGKAAFSADIGFQFDALSCVMSLLVSGVGLLIHIYSVGYMAEDTRDDRGFQRYFASLNLFIAAMLTLVLGDNLLMLFLGWEGVGLCSWLLIGFWYSDAANAKAASKAFIVNRVGDFGFLVGTFLLFWSLSDAGTPTIAFREIQAGFGAIADQRLALPDWALGALAALGWLPIGSSDMAFASVIGLCFVLAACGKSAQFPLHIWLPDAMAGPTPVSALIHAATMVTAGVYLVCRMSFLFDAAPEAGVALAWIGGATAFFAALAATAQRDIKRVLAWSTISQLGFMFVALGCGAYTVALFHVVTHAFFKGALFLGAGSVILACGHEQDLRRMGGLRGRLPRTHVSMLAAALSLAGFPLLAGFLSKDEILLAAHSAHALPGHEWLYAGLLFTAAVTAFYAMRLYFLIFWGNTRLDLVRRGRLREASSWMSQPLGLLAVLAVVGGTFGLPQLWGDLLLIEGSDSLGRFLVEAVVASPEHGLEAHEEWGLVGRSVIAFALGFTLALQLYALRDPGGREKWTRWLGPVHRAWANGYGFDALVQRALVRPLLVVSRRVLDETIDRRVVDAAGVHGVAATVRGLADGVLKFLHPGWMQSYLLTMALGLALLLVLVMGV